MKTSVWIVCCVVTLLACADSHTDSATGLDGGDSPREGVGQSDGEARDSAVDGAYVTTDDAAIDGEVSPPTGGTMASNDDCPNWTQFEAARARWKQNGPTEYVFVFSAAFGMGIQPTTRMTIGEGVHDVEYHNCFGTREPARWGGTVDTLFEKVSEYVPCFLNDYSVFEYDEEYGYPIRFRHEELTVTESQIAGGISCFATPGTDEDCPLPRPAVDCDAATCTDSCPYSTQRCVGDVMQYCYQHMDGCLAWPTDEVGRVDCAAMGLVCVETAPGESASCEPAP